MTYSDLIEWFEENEDVKHTKIKDLVEKIKGYRNMTDEKQAHLSQLLRESFGKTQYHYAYRRISKHNIKNYKSAYKTTKNYYYALRRVYE